MQSWLSWLVIGCILPAALVAGILIVESYQRERASMERAMIDTARALMQAVDADLSRVPSTIQVLAASPSLPAGDLRAFFDQAQAPLPPPGGHHPPLHPPPRTATFPPPPPPHPPPPPP